MKHLKKIFSAALFISAFILISYQNTNAHCDGLDGPVVSAAKKALETGNINYVLVWVGKEDENTVSSAFQKTQNVRKLSEEARELADTYFFETLVRIHRAGEGEAYTGLKPAGRDLGPVIPAADRAIKEGSIDKLKTVFEQKEINISEVEELFSKVIRNKDYNINDVEAGRKYVHSYVELLHTAEHLYAENEQKNTHNQNKGTPKHNKEEHNHL